MRARFGDGIEYRQQLAHSRHESDLLGLAGSDQSGVEGFEDRTAADSHERSHVERAAHVGTATQQIVRRPRIWPDW